jgi:hypothetical protein
LRSLAEQLEAPRSSVDKAIAEMVALTHDHERIQQFEQIKSALLTALQERLMASLRSD